ncbi:MAG: flagellar basal-body MS-ring/collar protein FliF [Syntrophales bacterium]|nr:flagellar basal-body MS-ring/collar protein FliF [Syntrophales bacterium]
MDPRQFLLQLWKGFNTLAPKRKMTILAVTAASIIGMGLLVFMAGQHDYKVLFSNLSSEDAGNIVAKLQEKKIPYKVSASGDSILVPQEKVSELRLDLAASGLPQGGGVGFEIFDTKSLGVTEFVQQLNYQRALQGELSRTINSLDEIQQSRVHIVIPKKSLFAEEQKKPTASVILKMKPGRKLKGPQIEGIARLVSSSVEGLSPSDVMVVDSTGKVLSKIQDESKMARMSTSQIEHQRNIEKDITNRLQTMLEKVVGEGNAVVRVSADLDFRIMEKTEERYDPEAPVVRSTQRQSEKSTTAAPAAPAPASKEPVSSATGINEKTDEVINYEINKVVNKMVMPVGEIRKLSIAVLVDGTYVKNDKGVEEYQPRSKKELADLEDLVKKSAGFDPKREDQVVVNNIPFKKVEADADLGKESWTESVSAFLPVIKYLVLLAVAVAFIMFFMRPLMRMLLVRGRTIELPREVPAGAAGEIEGAAVPMIGASEGKAYPEADVVKQMANTDARKFADLLRNWIRE